LIFDNQTDDAHPVHLHRNSFEITNVYGKPTAGIMKDIVLLKGFRKDGKPDVIPVASRGTELAWYGNPGWEKQSSSMTRGDAVGLARRHR
jgi:FtsP/CotA-like multicopper oxidase with cupredoxin domain